MNINLHYLFAIPTAGLLTALTACAANSGTESGTDEARVGSTDEAVVNGADASQPAWAVGILINNESEACTAWVLNEHWMLTAAHCVKDLTDGQSITVNRADGIGEAAFMYKGPADYFANPSWIPDTAEHDVGLIRITHFALRTDHTGFAKMYSDKREPWHDLGLPSDPWVAGWGKTAQDPNDPTSCVGSLPKHLTVGTLDLGFDSSVHYAVAGFVDQYPCAGDSGGPWALKLGDELIGFAVHSRRSGSPVLARGSLLADNRTWIESTIDTNAPTLFDERCSTFSQTDFEDKYAYRKCLEFSRGNATLKNQGRCLTAGGTLTTSACAASPAASSQAFQLLPGGQIALPDQSRCIDQHAGTAGSTASMAACNQNRSQRLDLRSDHALHSWLDTSLCLEVEGAAVKMEKCDGSAAQSWSWSLL